MADRDPIQPIHEPALAVIDEESTWVHDAADRFEHASAHDLLAWAIDTFGPRLAISAAGGVDGMALDRHGMAHRPVDPRLHARHRPSAAGDLHPVRGGARTLRHQGRVRSARRRRGRLLRNTERSQRDVSQRRPSYPVLHAAQGRAAEAQAGDARRLDHRVAPRAVGQPPQHRQGRARPRPRRPRQAQPARRLDGRRRLGLRPHQRGARTTSCSTTATPRSAARRARAR